jgi:hypothetical protein
VYYYKVSYVKASDSGSAMDIRSHIISSTTMHELKFGASPGVNPSQETHEIII